MIRSLQEFPAPIGGSSAALQLRTSDDALLLRRAMARMTPDRRGIAVVRYDRRFAEWQALRDPLFVACLTLHRELVTPYLNVAVRELADEARRAIEGA